MWHNMMDALPKDCEWVIGGDFNMTERREDKSNDCGRVINAVEKMTWSGLLNGFQLHDSFIYQGGPRLSWNNGQSARARRLARLDRFHTPSSSRLGIKNVEYFIHGYTVGSDHAPVQFGIQVGNNATRGTAFKWNISHLKGEITEALEEKWTSLPEGASFFHKLRNTTRFYRYFSKIKAKKFRKKELDTKARLEVALATLHEDAYDTGKQGEVSRLTKVMEELENKKARGATIRARVKWQGVGDKCSAEFFKSVRQKNTQAVITELKDIDGRICTRRKDLDRICLDFYRKLYAFKEILEEALEEVFTGFPVTFNDIVNVTTIKEITERDLGAVVRDLAKGKTPGHEGLSIEFSQRLWPTIGVDFHKMLLSSMEEGNLYNGVTKGLIRLKTNSSSHN